MRTTSLVILTGMVVCGIVRAAELVNDKVDWSAFLARQDLVWEVLPTESPHDVSFFKALGQLPVKGDSGAFLGNGLLGAVVFQKNTNTFCWGMGRSDVTEHRRDNGRLAVGDLFLTTVGKIQSGTMRLDLWNAEARGEIVTDKGSVKFRSLVHADRMVMLLDIETTGGESGAKFAWNPSTGQMTRGLAGPFLKKDPSNPAGSASVKDGVAVYTQPRIAGGEFAGAWKEVATGNTHRVYVTVADSFPGNTAMQEAVGTVNKAAASDYAGLVESHRAWWHALYPKSFVSFPDPKLESFYWIQIYKLASASRPGRGPVDEAGPWYRDQKEGFYSRIWWNLNIQIVNAPAYTANQLELAEPFIQLLDEHRDNFFEQGKKLWNCPEGASVSHTSDREGRRGDGHLSHNSFLNPGDFTWALQNYYLHYRTSMDHSMVTNQEKHAFYPLLRGAANVYLHLAKPGPDGKLHLPKLHSPEFGQDTDTSYNLSFMRWALQTLIALNERYPLNDSLLPKWRETLANLTPWPVDEKGYKVGATLGMTKSHRHWSHLFMVHPLHILDLDDKANRELFEKSLNHWESLGLNPDGWDRIEDWSSSGAACLFAALGNGDRALEHLHRHISNRTICRNTMSLGPWLSIEGAITVNRALQEMFLQSHGDLIRVFPAVPAGWINAVFHNFRAEGAFLVSAERKDGRTRWVRVKSLAGEPCRIWWDGQVKELPLAKDEETLLYVGEKPQPVVQPVPADPGKINAWGLRLADLAKPAPVAQVVAKPKPVPAVSQPKPLPKDATMPLDRLERVDWKTRHEAKVAQAKKGDIDVVFLGDSITQFLETKEFEAVWNKFNGNRKTLNLGYSSDQTGHLLWRLANGELDGVSPKAVVILAGINNLITGAMSAEETVKGLKAVVDKVNQLQPRTKIILLGLLPGSGRATDEVNKALEKTYQYSSFVMFRNPGEKFIKDGQASPEYYRGQDVQRNCLVHPGARGWEVIFETIEPDLVKVLPSPEADNANAQTELADKQRNVAKKGNAHPDAQWFPKAGLGLFMHWGIHSGAGVQPSWAIFESYGKKPSAEYIALAGKFDPQNYDPDKWFAAAAKAGFKYVVLTAKHADGYALWPSECGNFHSQRDLLKPYVEAARKHGLKVGFYYSPSDWTFNPEGWPYMGYPRRDGLKEHALKFGELDPAETQKRFETIYGYVKGQLNELLTRYGQIDLLWLDGFDWPGTLDDHGSETLAYLRTLQPGIVINDRWYLWPKPRTIGDYQTFEQSPPRTRPAGWWEFCNTIKGHWGYSPTHKISSVEQVLMQLAKARAWGGNYLPNIGPAPDGTLPEDVYKLFDELAAWMKHSGEAVGDVQPMPATVTCNVPVTVKDDKTWYFFATNEIVKIEATGVNEPSEAVLLRTGDKIKFARMNGTLELTLPAEKATRSLDVVKVRWK